MWLYIFVVSFFMKKGGEVILNSCESEQSQSPESEQILKAVLKNYC